MDQTIVDLKAWLERHDCRHVRPVRVFFGTPGNSLEQRDGCLYRRTLRYTEGMMAVTRGDRKAGETYTESSCYLLGRRPRVLLPGAPRRTKVCFTTGGSRDWYVACYIEAESITPRIAEYHPFGPSFIIKPWMLEEKIDAYEFHPRYHNRHVPYTRYPITFDLDALQGR